MTIMSQILGSSFGRGPAQQTPIMMRPAMQVPQMYAAPTREPSPQQQGTPTSAQGNPAAPGPDPTRAGSFIHPGTSPAAAAVPPTAAGNGVMPTGMAASAPTGGASGGVMQSIMNAFNAGAGGGMDMAKLLSMIGMAA